MVMERKWEMIDMRDRLYKDEDPLQPTLLLRESLITLH